MRKAPTTKVCTCCKTEKPISEFYYSLSTDRYFGQCKVCVREKTTARWKADRFKDAKHLIDHIQNVKTSKRTSAFLKAVIRDGLKKEESLQKFCTVLRAVDFEA